MTPSQYRARAQAISLIVTLLLGLACPALLPMILAQSATEPIVSEQNDPESILARGERLSLQESDLFALELIPGISDALGERLITYRRDIAETTQVLRPASKHRAYEIVRGIGKKTALKLYQSLAPSASDTRWATVEGEIDLIQSVSKPGQTRRAHGAQPISTRTAKRSKP